MTGRFRTWMSRQCRFVPLAAGLALVGCSTTSKQDVLESRLRHQEDMIASYQSQLDRAKTELDIAQRESASLRTQLANTGKAGSKVAARDHIDASFRASAIEFSSLMTGGADVDGLPGDDGLTVVLVPQDPAGEIVKVPGKVEVEAFDLSSPDGAVRIGHWVFDNSESHRYWHKGVIQSGYQLELPWQDLPKSESLLLHGRLVAVDGRQFDTTHTVRIEPPDPKLAKRSSSQNQGSSIQQTSATSPEGPTSQSSKGEAAPLSQSWSNAPSQESDTSSASPMPGFSEAQSLTGREFADRIRRSPSLGVGRPVDSSSPSSKSQSPKPPSSEPSSTAEPPASLHGTPTPWGNSLKEVIPPKIQDVRSDAEESSGDDWYQQVRRPASRPPVRTSDSWTDATIPYVR